MSSSRPGHGQEVQYWVEWSRPLIISRKEKREFAATVNWDKSWDYIFFLYFNCEPHESGSQVRLRKDCLDPVADAVKAE